MAENPSPQLNPGTEISGSVVFVPNILRRQGWGHFRRCRDAALESGAVLYLPFDLLPESKTFSREELASQSRGCSLTFTLPEPGVYRLAVLDGQKTPLIVYHALKNLPHLLLVGWDEGGKCRKKVPYLVDSLPNLSAHRPNDKVESLTGIYQTKPDLRSEIQRRAGFQKVLVVFGGGDPQNLTEKTLGVMGMAGFFSPNRRVSVVRGPAVQWRIPPQKYPVAWLAAPERLKDQLEDYDLVVTSWGLTALEALAAGVPVVLLNPEPYHDQLSRQEGLVRMGVRRTSVSAFRKALDQAVEASLLRAEKLPQELSPTVQEYFSSLRYSSGVCPACTQSSDRIIHRLPTKTYFRCPNCSMEFLQTFHLPEKQYQESYFFEDYRRQYGKTYLEDFASIQAMGKARLDFACEKGFSAKDKVVFDIGCAYGPFLQAVQKAGGKPYGLDISSSAVDYVKQQLGLPAVCAPFPDFQWEKAFPGQEKPDMVTLWYVIEHFEDLTAVLTTIGSLLAPGGWLAFSTPHGRGISRLFQTQKFWEQSPDDHFTVWNRSNARKVLRRYGFRLKAFRITGHHPERFPGVPSKESFRYKFLSVWSQLFGWGDTFEIYAVKESK